MLPEEITVIGWQFETINYTSGVLPSFSKLT